MRAPASTPSTAFDPMRAALRVALLSPPELAVEPFARALARRWRTAPLGLRVAVLQAGKPRNSAPTHHDLILYAGHDAHVLAHCANALLITDEGASTEAEDTLRTALLSRGTRWSVVRGLDEAAQESALDAVLPWLLPRLRPAAGHGLFSRLRVREAAQPAWAWVCDSCDSPECEHANLRARRLAVNPPAG